MPGVARNGRPEPRRRHRGIAAQPGDGAKPEWRFGMVGQCRRRGFEMRYRFRQPAKRLQGQSKVQPASAMIGVIEGARQQRQCQFRRAGAHATSPAR